MESLEPVRQAGRGVVRRGVAMVTVGSVLALGLLIVSLGSKWIAGRSRGEWGSTT